MAVWWSWSGNGIAIARDRWPAPVRLLAVAGWVLWLGGMAVQLLGHVAAVGVARW